MNIMVSILEFSKNSGGFSSNLRLIPLASAESFFPSVDFSHYINDGENVDFYNTIYSNVKPVYKQKESFLAKKNTIVDFIKSSIEKYKYALIGGKKRLVRIFNVGNMIAYWDIEVGKNSTICTLRSKRITTSKSYFDFVLVSLEVDRKNKQVIFHSSSGGENYISVVDILNFGISTDANHKYTESKGFISINVLKTHEGRDVGVTAIYEFLEHSEDHNVKSMPILINDVIIENNEDFYKVSKDFMRGM